MAFNLFPYSNFHKLNLDWVIKTIQEAKEALDQAAQTVTGYESRLAAVESRLAAVESSVSTLSASVNLLRGTVHGHTELINSLDTRLSQQNTAIQAQKLRIDQAQSDIQNHTQQINEIQSNKVDINTGHAYDLRVIYNAEDPDNGVALEGMGGPFNGIAFRPVQDGQKNMLTFSPITVGFPTSTNHAATKAYVDNAANQALEAANQALEAVANKVDNLNGKAARLTLAAYQESGPSDQYGVRIDANPGTRTGLEFRPINNGTLDTSVFAELSIGDPTADTSAATKRYVDGRTLTPYTYETKTKWDQEHPDNLLESLPGNSIVTILSSLIHPADVPGSISGAAIYGSIITINSEEFGSNVPKHQIIMERGSVWIRFLPGSVAAQAWYRFNGTLDQVQTS